MEEANDLLDKYKKHPFARGLLPFEGAVKSLKYPFPVIYPHQEGNQRWVMYDTNTKKPAIFSHATAFAQCDPVETGNFVPEGEQKAFSVEPRSIQSRANTKCMYTYIFDTFHDLSLYECQWDLDEYMKNAEGFNVGTLPRRPYLSGVEAKYRSRFWMQTPMFIRRAADEERVPPPGHLHAWVRTADEKSKIFRANPDRPRVWVKTPEGILPLADSGHGDLQRGDILTVSFMITYHKTSSYWFPQFHPLDLVVLKPNAFDGTEYGAPVLNLHSQPPPSFDESLVTGSRDGDCKDTVGVLGSVESVSGGSAKDDVSYEVSAGASVAKGDDEKQERVEFDEGLVPAGGVPGAGGVGNEVDVDGFTLVDSVGADKAVPVEGFVEVTGDDEDKKNSRAVGRVSRQVRKRG